MFPIAIPKAHALTGRITRPRWLAAFQAVKRHRGAAGIDKVSINLFAARLIETLLALERDWKDGSFSPFPLRRPFIPQEPGRFRPLDLPAVRDRVAQEVVRRLLPPICEPLLHDASFGFRPGRNCHRAPGRVLDLPDPGVPVVLDADIKGFFDHLSHEVIREAVAAQVSEGNLLRLIEKFLRAGVVEEGVFKPTTMGTPQGGVISPVLANSVRHHLDGRRATAGYRFVRQADDCVVLCQTHAQAEEALPLVTPTLTDLGRSLSSEKTRITISRTGYSFPGFVRARRSRRMRDQSERKLRDKMRALTCRSHHPDAPVIVKLNQVIRGPAPSFATRGFTGRSRLRELDSWIRRRVRCMKFKRFSDHDTRRFRVKQFEQLGLLRWESFGWS